MEVETKKDAAPQSKLSQDVVYVRKQKTLIVGPKSGVTAFLARLAAFGIALLRATAPLSITLMIVQVARFAVARRAYWMSRNIIKRGIAYVVAIESAFFVYMKLKERSLQHRRPEKVPVITAEERRILFDRCVGTAATPRHFIESWFEPVVPYNELGRDNIADLLAWSMFHASSADKLSDAEKTQLEGMVDHIETRLGKLPPGMNPKAQVLKFTEEPVEGKHRPLLMYMVVHVLFQVVMAPMQMRLAGYSNKKQGELTYWYRPGKNPNLPPVCFLHGIGIGILPYQKFFRVVERMCDAETGGLAGRGVLIPEIQVISQRLNPSVLHCETFVPDLKQALKESSGHEVACVVGHSYGSFLVSWLVKHAPEMVGAVGLVDPASILLHNTEVLHNIVYHRPLPNAVEAVLDYIMRSEISLVHNLKREFFWFKNVLFFEEINTIQSPTFVVLGDTDQLVPIYEIKDYIERYNNGQFIDVPNAPHLPAAPIDLVWFEKCDHAGFLFNWRFEQKVAEAMAAACARSPRMQART